MSTWFNIYGEPGYFVVVADHGHSEGSGEGECIAEDRGVALGFVASEYSHAGV